MMDDQNVLNKVKKLLALADRRRNKEIAETESAMFHAHKLLRKHHLSMSQVMALDDGHGTNCDFLEIKEEEAASFKANVVPKWMMQVIMAVNRVTHTKTLINRTPRETSNYADLRIIFVGESLDVYASVELFNFLKSSVTKLSSSHRKKVSGNFRHWRSFAEGCSDTLLNRARQLDAEVDKKINRIFNLDEDAFDVSNFELSDDDDYEEIDEEIDELLKDETALVLYGQYKETKFGKIADYLGDKRLDEESVPGQNSKIDEESFELGNEAGEQIPLHVAKKLQKQ
jgi:hypothetical protein